MRRKVSKRLLAGLRSLLAEVEAEVRETELELATIRRELVQAEHRVRLLKRRIAESSMADGNGPPASCPLCTKELPRHACGCSAADDAPQDGDPLRRTA